jgi:Spy/CpxP family protein refolding chaperone
VLQLERELQLSTHQREHVAQVFQKMKTRAAELGRQYIEAERAVDTAFTSATADASTVAARVLEASRLLGELRLAHLEAHVEITPLLTPEQRARYADLRGYSAAHPQLHKH